MKHLLITPGSRIVEEREHQGMSQIELARKAKISQGTMSEIENGRTKRPRGDSLTSICRVLRLNPAYVINGTMPKYADAEFPIDVWSILSAEDKSAVLKHMLSLHHMNHPAEQTETKKANDFTPSSGRRERQLDQGQGTTKKDRSGRIPKPGSGEDERHTDGNDLLPKK